jgi:intergrase/recombinase
MRICGTGHMAVDFFCCRFVLRFELCLDIRRRLAILLRTFKNTNVTRQRTTQTRFHVPAYSWKHIVKGDFLIFSSNKSFLLRKRIIDVSVNHLLLQIESNNFKLSCIRFWNQKYFNQNNLCFLLGSRMCSPRSIYFL